MEVKYKFVSIDGKLIPGERGFVDGKGNIYLTEKSADSNRGGLFRRVYNVKTLMYTGFKDINGREIYEGDRVIADGKEGRVIWKDAAFYVKFEDKPKNEKLLSFFKNTLKVI